MCERKEEREERTGRGAQVLRKDLCPRAWGLVPLRLHQAGMFQWIVNVLRTSSVPSINMFYDGSN